ncbi:glutathione S-transferase family protein [Nordella sp. HKS 07]|uniref:glutathione S-transferase family protein n=1 Tax=Nordella sp. HKS 07 TaxID=2712222 RepID=UPI0013E18964|nr:glutathione S-transferase family protein [Nordella sp. HKS 07]QIG47318.1 glutathione S-transferase family protein [Nordella sp. HKS 07]
MKLYLGPGPNSDRVRIFLAEKGLDLPVVPIDFGKREHKSAEFLKLNSLGQVPVLQLDDGEVITESVAICRYVEAIHPSPPLFGSDAPHQGKAEMWNRRMEQEVFGTIGNVVLHTDEFFKERHTQVPEFAEAQRRAIPSKWMWLDREISDGRPYLAGDEFSIADICGMVTLMVSRFFGYEMPAEIPNVQRWAERLRQRPSWQAMTN